MRELSARATNWFEMKTGSIQETAPDGPIHLNHMPPSLEICLISTSMFSWQWKTTKQCHQTNASTTLRTFTFTDETKAVWMTLTSLTVVSVVVSQSGGPIPVNTILFNTIIRPRKGETVVFIFFFNTKYIFSHFCRENFLKSHPHLSLSVFAALNRSCVWFSFPCLDYTKLHSCLFNCVTNYTHYSIFFCMSFP